MSSGLVDAHTHLDFPDFDGDRAEVLGRAVAAGVTTVAVCGSDPNRWDLLAALPVVAWFGVHPWVAAELDDAGLDDLLARLAARRPARVGEIGLDRLRAPDPAAWDRQVRALRDQLALAREGDHPVQLHGVRAWPELLSVCRRDGLPRAGGVAHAFTGAPDQALRAVELGLYVSFGPAILRDRARKARASAAVVPRSRLLVETDCPDGRLPGKERGEPADLPVVVAALAELRGESADDLGPATADNFRRAFGGMAPETRTITERS